MDGSGVVFRVKFMGYAPVLKSLRGQTLNDCDFIVSEIVQSTVEGYPTKIFRNYYDKQVVGNFQSMAALDTNLIITKHTISLFHVRRSSTKLLARYPTEQLSFHKNALIKNHIFFAFVISLSDKRECNVMNLLSQAQANNINQVLQEADVPIFSAYNERRMQSSQLCEFTPEMSTFYHGSVSNNDYTRKFQAVGDFLFRASESTPGKIVLVCHEDEGSAVCYEKSLEEMIEILEKYPYLPIKCGKTLLKRAVPRDLERYMK